MSFISIISLLDKEIKTFYYSDIKDEFKKFIGYSNHNCYG
jgi:DNA-directed RNA polymerase delta subunit